MSYNSFNESKSENESFVMEVIWLDLNILLIKFKITRVNE